MVLFLTARVAPESIATHYVAVIFIEYFNGD
jgi:hypothetical protein